MPRQPRLDAPGTLHHVIVRGLERRARTLIFDEAGRPEGIGQPIVLRQRPHLGDDVDVPGRTDLGGSRIGQEEARGTAAQEDHPVGENARKESGTFLL